MINIQALLGDIGVPYWTSGKNVSAGWTSIQCPMCSDISNHGGFSPDGIGYSCFKCGKHSIFSVLSALTSRKEASELLKEYSNSLVYYKGKEKERAATIEWPPECAVKTMPSIHAEYLHKRGYNPKKLRKLYKIQCCYQTGFMKYRIVIPIFHNGRVVTYVGRDVTDKAVLRYKNYPERKSIMTVKETVYNIDAIHKVAIVTEGIFDSWRFGSLGTCTFGTQFTASQINMLSKKIEWAVICFDKGRIAQQKARELGENFSLQGVTVDLLTIDTNDPGELPQSDADDIISMVLKNA